MDERDVAILTELQRDARLTNRQLAARVGLAPSSTLVRTRALERSGVLAGYHARVDLGRIGRGVQAMIGFQVRPLSRDVINGFKTFALGQPEVLSVYVVAGGDDFLVHVAVPSVEAMHAMVMDRFSSRKEVIGFRTTLLYEHTQNPAVLPADQEP
ncbi:Lrp/AsnC family transcriptional regulator [Kineosporia sp. J2-2]|uniref:Lrp/AsnC family transcriptional regulator n=1 Tax=Kineosporia corallincola TaxID=2835133 RepID=A0ABS5TD52_9ACTN|nr:Lrp/AsnC family transcriptional regulator [Kineosporia corallincola]MBT0768773.1 Lrp/AsnC family transcriptional regulator [Kineosporia corallincola]